MKGILRKKEDHYFFWSSDWDPDKGDGFVANTARLVSPKLSLKNCQAIENGYDLDELVKERFGETFWHDGDKYFKEGFQKAIEILGDKKFSEEDILKAIAFGWDYEGRPKEEMLEIYNINLEYNNSYFEDTKKYIQSLQQTEWDVIVEIECCGNYSSCNLNCEHGPKPKLDADGCLILKRC